MLGNIVKRFEWQMVRKALNECSPKKIKKSLEHRGHDGVFEIILRFPMNGLTAILDTVLCLLGNIRLCSIES